MRSLLFCLVAVVAAFGTTAGCRVDTQQASDNKSPTEKSPKQELAESDAVRIAEQFLSRNGYTDTPPSDNKSEIVYEITDPNDRALALSLRSNTLESSAYNATRLEKPREWMVVFRYSSTSERLRSRLPDFDSYIKLWGRAVVMDLDGSNVHLEHQDIGLEPT